MAELRWLIVLFGVLFVVGVYLAMRRQDSRRGPNVRAGERQEPSLSVDEGVVDDPWEELRREPELTDGHDVTDDFTAPGPADPDRTTPAYLRKREEAENAGASTGELPVVTVGERVSQVSEAAVRPARRPAEQLELGVPDPEPSDPVEGEDEPPEADIEEVFTLRLVPRSAGAFAGDAVGQGLLTAGLARGRFDIFHYQPPGAAQSVFSVANLVEPGTLREEDLAGQSLPGLTMFMLLPGPLPGLRALEEMITCSRLLANYLDATVQDDTGGSLTRQTEEHLKERVVDFEHRRTHGER
ncbi:MAG: cell division protein ZipA C-terminal FtsZ-binding domain-containing protein [Pseudomonadota bacterium]